MTTTTAPKAAPSASPTPRKARPVLLILSRAAAAILGGYALASAATIFLAAVLLVFLPLPRAEAVLASTLLSFAVYTGAIIWVYAEHNIRRVWLGLLGASAVLAAVGLLLGQVGT